MRTPVPGTNFIKLGDLLPTLKQVPAIAYLRGAEAALRSDPPDGTVALQLISQALALLDPPGGATR
jgi:hypothetical protein